MELVLVVAAHHSIRQLADALLYGADEYLVPPFDGALVCSPIAAAGK